MVVTINGKEVCNSKVVYGGEGHITKGSDGKERGTINTTTECQKAIKVSKGDRLNVVANYDLDQHPAYVLTDGIYGRFKLTCVLVVRLSEGAWAQCRWARWEDLGMVGSLERPSRWPCWW
jgi:hypothetical protein